MDVSGRRSYRDLQQHIAELKSRDLIYEIDEPVNKDTEMLYYKYAYNCLIELYIVSAITSCPIKS